MKRWHERIKEPIYNIKRQEINIIMQNLNEDKALSKGRRVLDKTKAVSLNFLKIILICLCVCVYMGMQVPWRFSGDERATSANQYMLCTL